LESLRTSIPEILALSQLSGVFKRLGVIAYKDYSDDPDEIVSWSGWNRPDLVDFVTALRATGGGDYPEAAKSALIRALKEIKRGGSEHTLVLWYADAPPHHPYAASSNIQDEIKAFPDGATDWIKLSFMAQKLNATVFGFVPDWMPFADVSFYVFLCQVTSGLCILTNNITSGGISRLTLETILQWMGQGVKVDASESTVRYLQYEKSPLKAQPQPTNEINGSLGYLPPPKRLHKATPLLVIKVEPLQATDIPIGSLASSPLNLPQRFRHEPEYQEQVYKNLTAIINSNVYALTYNAIFGQLWRTVCAQPPSAEQSALLNAFSSRVGAVSDSAKKLALQKWLEDSYDATAHIEQMMEHATPGGPNVYLDLDADIELTRIEMLEVSRSCYAGVLKKLASIFTHLKVCTNFIPH
jgi:hypothetical protein